MLCEYAIRYLGLACTRTKSCTMTDAKRCRLPHLFEFLDENYMLEWWACDFAAWYYKPYRYSSKQLISGLPPAEGGPILALPLACRARGLQTQSVYNSGSKPFCMICMYVGAVCHSCLYVQGSNCQVLCPRQGSIHTGCGERGLRGCWRAEGCDRAAVPGGQRRRPIDSAAKARQAAGTRGSRASSITAAGKCPEADNLASRRQDPPWLGRPIGRGRKQTARRFQAGLKGKPAARGSGCDRMVRATGTLHKTLPLLIYLGNMTRGEGSGGC